MIMPSSDEDITMNEALALLHGMDLQQFRRDNIDLLDEFEKEAIKCHVEQIAAKETGDAQAIKVTVLAAQTARHKLKYASDLRVKLAAEIARVRMNKPAIICIVYDTPNDPHCDVVLIKKQSLFEWANHQKILIAPTAIRTPDPETIMTGQGATEPQQGTDMPVGVANKNLLVTTRIIAHALGGMVDKLVQDDRINVPDEQPCINKDDLVNWPVLAGYISSQSEMGEPGGPVASGSQVSTDPETVENQELVLAIVADSLAHLADTARIQGWVIFTDITGERDRRTFLRNGHFVSRRIYGYLLRIGTIKKDTPNQGASNIQHKLGHALKRLISTDVPAFNPALFQKALEFADRAYAEKFRLAPRTPAGLSG